MGPSLQKIFFIVTVLLVTGNRVTAQQDTLLKKTLPKAGKLLHDKPVGKGWVNLLAADVIFDADSPSSAALSPLACSTASVIFILSK